MSDTELDSHERRAVEDMLNAKMPVSKIAGALERHRSTVFREIKRNRFEDRKLPYLSGHCGVTAYQSAAARRARRGKLVRLKGLRKAVITQLKEGWSPEQIAGRL